jgi:hypothetical protein
MCRIADQYTPLGRERRRLERRRQAEKFSAHNVQAFPKRQNLCVIRCGELEKNEWLIVPDVIS